MWESVLEWIKNFTRGESPIALLAMGLTAGFFVGRYLIRNPQNVNRKRELAEAEADLESEKSKNKLIEPQITNLARLRDALDGEEDELWKLHGADAPVEVRERLAEGQPKTITVMNLKGGVGKTTTVANLAAHFGEKGKRVLVVDLDYQGSLSRMLMLTANIRVGQNDEPRVIDFLSGQQDARALRNQVISLHATIPNVDLVSCGTKFDRFENRAMISWLIGDEKEDVRFCLAKVLISRAFQDYQLIILDAPPRLSTGAINALLASHAVLVPTVLDRLSAEAIGPFVARMNTMRSMNTSLEFVGVIGTLRGQIGGFDVAGQARDTAKQGLENWVGTSCLFKNDIKYITNLAREAGTNVGYLKHKNVRDVYQLLASEIEQEMRL